MHIDDELASRLLVKEGSAMSAHDAGDLWREIDALRARLAEMEQERENNQGAWECLDMIREDILAKHLGEEESKNIAPMFYTEALITAMQAQIDKAMPGLREKARRYEQAEAIAEREKGDAIDLRAEVAALTADKEALVPLARLGDWALDAARESMTDLYSGKTIWAGAIIDEADRVLATRLEKYAAARAVLGRRNDDTRGD